MSTSPARFTIQATDNTSGLFTRAMRATDRLADESGPDAHLVASIEAVLDEAIRDFQRTTKLVDGTRSAQVGRWAAEFARVAVMTCPHTLSDPAGLPCTRTDVHTTGHVFVASEAPDGHDASEAAAEVRHER